MQKKSILIINKLGLHARAAAKFVATASRFGAKVDITRNGKTVNGKSIMGVMMLAASKGTEIEITTDGEDEIEALEAIDALINDRFGEDE